MSSELITQIMMGVNVCALFLAIRRLGALELMVQTMWNAFVSRQFLTRESDSSIAHDHP